MFPDKIYYEPAALQYALGKRLREKYGDVQWVPIQSHNNIPELRARENSEFPALKRLLILGVRKTHKYVPNRKVSDFLVPYTSSGCQAVCLYCYLVCHYNKCAYLRLFVNREQMLDKLMRAAASADKELTFEIGSNSDLVLENTITGNLPWTIERFAGPERGFLTFPTKFSMVEPLLGLAHRGRVIARVSVNPPEVIRGIERGTSPLEKRISALNNLAEDGYKTGLLIAPVVLLAGWEKMYGELVKQLADTLSAKARNSLFIEIIFMTYSYVHRAINREAYPDAPDLYDRGAMTGRGRGLYCYREDARARGEAFLRAQLEKHLPGVTILYVS